MTDDTIQLKTPGMPTASGLARERTEAKFYLQTTVFYPDTCVNEKC